MKKVIVALIIISSMYIVYQLYERYLNSKDKEIFIKLTGISKFELISDVRNFHYQYMIAKISRTDKQMMLSQHYYKSTPINLNGHLSHEIHFVNENDYVYYLEDSGHGYLAYVLYLISKADNKVIVYTSYAD